MTKKIEINNVIKETKKLGKTLLKESKNASKAMIRETKKVGDSFASKAHKINKNLKSKKLTAKEKQIQNKLKINNWSELTEDKIPQFVELIPKMGRETSTNAFNSFADWNYLSRELVQHLTSLFDKALSEINVSSNESISAYRLVLDRLNEQVQEKDISQERKQLLNEQMIEIAKCIDRKDTEKKEYIMKVLGALTKVGVLALGIGALAVTKDTKLLEKFVEKTEQ